MNSPPGHDPSEAESPQYDAVVIGSGFGGAMAALPLVQAGWRLLMLERGDWVRRGPHNWAPEGTVDLTPHYSLETPYHVATQRNGAKVGIYACVGGPSVFFGGVSLRFREEDFVPDPDIVEDSGARWPLEYEQLEPFYTRAERILDVAGAQGEDPTEPWRSAPYPQESPPLSNPSRKISEAASRLGMQPFRLPLAINFREEPARRGVCARCTTCDTFACAVAAKNDIATVVMPALLEAGMTLRSSTVAVGLEEENGSVRRVHCVDRRTGRRFAVRARLVILAAGALGSPHLLLASGLEQRHPGGSVVGRYLMRHRNAIVFGVFPHPPDPVGEFHKQVGIHDHYFGERKHRGERSGGRKLGAIQQVQTPPVELVRQHLPEALGYVMNPRVDYLGGLLVMAEDQPRRENRLSVDPSRADRFGLPRAEITHRYTPRDRAAVRALADAARRVLREAGALFFYLHRIQTFSHAVGTVRMGRNPRSSAVDPEGRFRGVDNLWVSDGSLFPTAGGLNPSLTIAALALRVGERILERHG